mmetsp:Transcript_14547/g.31883  ORF Transcript_14547/g.31883 Transcript_14547/m.31883 type:complete len:80 (+) Transcript_14547:70-309(+)
MPQFRRARAESAHSAHRQAVQEVIAGRHDIQGTWFSLKARQLSNDEIWPPPLPSIHASRPGTGSWPTGPPAPYKAFVVT